MKKIIVISLMLVLSLGFSAIYANDDGDISDAMELESVNVQSGDWVVKELLNDVECKEKKKYLGHINDYEFWFLSGSETFEHRCNQGFSFCKVIFNERESSWYLVSQASSKNCGSSCGGAITNCYATGKLRPLP